MAKVLIVGAGAAGLMAAGAAVRQGHQVTVLEHMDKPGQKILVTGKGRCNVTNDCPAEEFLRHVRTNPRFLYSSLGAFPPAKTMELFEGLGVELKVERGRRVFPVSDKAEEIRQALLRYAQDADIVYDGWKAPSIMQGPGARDVAVEFFTLSKSYNMAGWRIGFMVGNKTLVSALARIKSYHDYGTFTPLQVAAIAALEGDQQCVRDIAEQYKRRRDVLVKGLHEAGWMVEMPKVSMCVWQ